MLARMFAVDSKLAPGIMSNGAFFLDREPDVFKVFISSAYSYKLFKDFQIITNFLSPFICFLPCLTPFLLAEAYSFLHGGGGG